MGLNWNFTNGNEIWLTSHLKLNNTKNLMMYCRLLFFFIINFSFCTVPCTEGFFDNVENNFVNKLPNENARQKVILLGANFLVWTRWPSVLFWKRETNTHYFIEINSYTKSWKNMASRSLNECSCSKHIHRVINALQDSTFSLQQPILFKYPFVSGCKRQLFNFYAQEHWLAWQVTFIHFQWLLVAISFYLHIYLNFCNDKVIQ